MEDIDVTPTIHHTDTVSIAIGCSYRPIALDIKDIINLFEVLVRTELIVDCSCGKNSRGLFWIRPYGSNTQLPHMDNKNVAFWSRRH